VIYPPIELDKYRTEHDGDGYVTTVNPRAAYEGTDIFLDIADSRSDEEFLLVGPISQSDFRQRAAQAKNVTHWEWYEDMCEAYAASKLVVVPSRWEEPFGRVPAEAMVGGVPCVVSDRGGLPEVVGDTGEVVSDIGNVDAWIAAFGPCARGPRSTGTETACRAVLRGDTNSKLLKLIEDCVGSEATDRR
jgi:glycosyltransferase involved in cell wall biosynthesis